ncbi:zinc ribbon domain-containing protein [Fodinibius sp.]|uniref:zinc ribbon domain-containing protein n=1 Tax=Fodinibius sp. TaxID=1872440 RepID=UPI003A0FF4B0
MPQQNWECPKCGNQHFEVDELSGTGGGVSKFFNVQTKKFTTVTCSSCKYTELYKGETSTLYNVLDFFGN